MYIGIPPVGNIVRSAREARNLSQTALAKKIAVSKQTIIAVEKNQRNPKYEVFCRLVHALGISADLIVYPDRASYTVELDQLFRDLLACDERDRKIAIGILQGFLRALRHDEPEKQD